MSNSQYDWLLNHLESKNKNKQFILKNNIQIIRPTFQTDKNQFLKNQLNFDIIQNELQELEFTQFKILSADQQEDFILNSKKSDIIYTILAIRIKDQIGNLLENKKTYCQKLIYLYKKLVGSFYNCSYLDDFEGYQYHYISITGIQENILCLINKEKLTENSIIKYLKDILEGVVQANKLGIFLPNIKLENIFLDYNNNAKICIFQIENETGMNKLENMFLEYNEKPNIYLKNETKEQKDIIQENQGLLDDLQKLSFVYNQENQDILQKILNKALVNPKIKQGYTKQCMSLGKLFCNLISSQNTFKEENDQEEIIKIMSQSDQFAYKDFFQQTIKQFMVPEQTQFIDLYEILLRFKGILDVELNLESLFNETYLEEKYLHLDSLKDLQCFQILWTQIAQDKYFPIIKEEEEFEKYIKCQQKKPLKQFEIMENKFKEQLNKIEKLEKIILENSKIIKKLQEQLDEKQEILNEINLKQYINTQQQIEPFNKQIQIDKDTQKLQQKQINNKQESGYYCKACKFLNRYIYEDYDSLIYYCNMCQDFTEHLHFQ